MSKLEIEITDDVTSKTKTLKEHTTEERAREILANLYENDYLDLTYSLWRGNKLIQKYGSQ